MSINSIKLQLLRKGNESITVNIRNGLNEETRSSKVGAIRKAQTCKAFKIVKRRPFGFLKTQFAAKYLKIERGNLETFKKFEVSQSRKKGRESLSAKKLERGSFPSALQWFCISC